MTAIAHTLREGVYRCTGCGDLHLDASDECILECDGDMEPVEVVAVDQLQEAVEALEQIANPDCMVRRDHPDGGCWIDTEAPARIAANALDVLRVRS